MDGHLEKGTYWQHSERGEGKFAPSGTTFIQWLAQLPYMLRGSSLFRFMAPVLERAQGEVFCQT